MPKLKSITTGSVPSFVDLILNFDEADTSSTLAAQDTWLAQLKRKDAGKLILYGDDTWLKLFPETFDRHDGTSSFFVSVRNFSFQCRHVSNREYHRTLQRLTTMSPAMFQKNLETKIGGSWSYITWDWIILDTNQAPEAQT